MSEFLPIHHVEAPTLNLAYAEAVNKFGLQAMVLNYSLRGDKAVLTICEVDTTGLDPLVLKRAMDKPISTVTYNSDNNVENAVAEIMHMIQSKKSLKHDVKASDAALEADCLELLVDLGFDYKYSKSVLARDDVKSFDDALNSIYVDLPASIDDIVSQGGWISFMGPTGVGKTTTLSKIASLYSKRFGASHVALVTVDTYRVGAVKQLQEIAEYIGVEFYVCDNPVELRELLGKLSDKKLVLLDTAGSSQKDKLLHLQLKQYLDHNIKNLLVMHAGTQFEGMSTTIEAFSEFGINSIILTKLDEVVKFGGALSALSKYSIPIQYVTTGQNVPQDIEPLSAKQLMVRALELTGKKYNLNVA